jgi:hypothetical protein
LTFSASTQPKRLADDEGVHRDREHQRVFSGLLQHLVELVDHHLGELAPGVAALNQRRRVVDLERVGHRQDRPGVGPSILADRPSSNP